MGLRSRPADTARAKPRSIPYGRVQRSSGARGAARARASRLDRRRADRPPRCGRAALVEGQSRARGNDRGPSRQRGGAAGVGNRAGRRRPRRRLDGHGLAADDGERGPERLHRGEALARRGRDEGGGVTIAPDRTRTALDTAVERATERLLELQHPDGWWVGELESNATMIAQHLSWHHFLGLRTPELDRKIGNELLARQRDDGTWSIWFDGPADLSTSIEAYAALRLAGADPGRAARDYIRAYGGVPRARVFTKCFLALLGQWPWQWVARVPAELILLP